MAARPTNRTVTAESPRGSSPRPAVRDFTGATGQAIEWDVRSVYDFLFSLSEDAGSTDDLPAADRAWLLENRAAIGSAGGLNKLVAHDLSVHVASFAVERPELRTVDSFVDAIETAGPAPLLRAVFCEALAGEPTARPLFDRALAGEVGAIPALEAALPEWKRKERISLLEDPKQTHAHVVELLRAWAERFRSIDERITEILARDYEARSVDRTTLPTSELIERTTAGIRWLPEPGVRRLILAPSYFSRPFNFLLAGDDWRFFGYPVADSALEDVDPLAPPLAVLRLHRALGDPTRLRILKLLAAGDLYLTEIAQQLELSKPTIKHHLTQLRVAGLLTVVEAGAVVYYSLRRDRLDDAAVDIKRFLIH
jgi:DNA-binding transcriptional ArsR family regulator